MFHVSLLKKKVGDRIVVQSRLRSTGSDSQFLVQQVAILQIQIVKKKNTTSVQVLVQWSNLPPEDSTGEDYQFFLTKFPNFDPNP